MEYQEKENAEAYYLEVLGLTKGVTFAEVEEAYAEKMHQANEAKMSSTKALGQGGMLQPEIDTRPYKEARDYLFQNFDTGKLDPNYTRLSEHMDKNKE